MKPSRVKKFKVFKVVDGLNGCYLSGKFNKFIREHENDIISIGKKNYMRLVNGNQFVDVYCYVWYWKWID